MKRKIDMSFVLPVITLALLIIVGSQLSSSFLSLKNFTNIIQFAVEVALIGIGMTFVLITGGIDLSVGSVLAFSSVVSASMALSGISIVLIIIVVIIVGLICGLINGLLISRFGVEPFMATLSMMMIMRAATFLYTGGGPLTGSVSESFKAIIKGRLVGIQNGIWYLVIAFLIAYIILNHARFGRHLYAIGGSEETALLFGVNVSLVKTVSYMVSGVLASISGLFIASRIGIGEPRSGIAYEMTAITVCVIGGISMAGGRGNIFGTFIGVMVVSMIKNLMNLMNINVDAQPIVTGIIILITALIISREATSKLDNQNKSF